MKNIRPYQLVLLASGFSAIVALLILSLFSEEKVWRIILVALLVGIANGIVFYFIIRYFISERLKVLYRSIRKGKFDKGAVVSGNLFTDFINEAEEETRIWNDARNKEIKELREKEEFRKEFLGNLAHELKTPVFSIQGYILTLLEGGLEDESINRSFLERASKATDRMTSILEDLDQITKLEVNEIQLDLVHFNIYELVSDIFADLRLKAKSKKIKLKFSKEYSGVFVKADKNKVAQVLTNLINNSISYGNEGGETVVRFYIIDDLITVEVSDNGPGIDEAHLPRLFERFYRVEKSRNRNEGGTGLGLAIAKHIIEAHGHTISVRSTLEVGSTFIFSLDKGKASLAK